MRIDRTYSYLSNKDNVWIFLAYCERDLFIYQNKHSANIKIIIDFPNYLMIIV